MLGAIAGDIIGSVYEKHPLKIKEFKLFSNDSHFTDDTVLTLAVADVILHKKSYATVFRDFYHKYPDQGYGYGFTRWVTSDNLKPFYSHGNGSAMRVNPIGWAFNSLSEVLEEARKSAVVTHNHEEGVKGAQAVAATIFLARTGHEKEEIKQYLKETFKYNLDRELDNIRPNYKFDVSCEGSVPESIIAFLESVNFEDAVRNAISLGGDSDTMASIAGAIAEAYYRQIDREIAGNILDYLPLHLSEIAREFIDKYCQ